MVKIIETNMSFNGNDEMMDFQSRIINVDSWYDYVNEIKNRESVFRNSYIGNMSGVTLPREADVLEEKYDHYHLNITFYYLEFKMTKLACLIEE